MFNPKTIKACLCRTCHLFLIYPLIPSSVVPIWSVALLEYVFLIYPLLLLLLLLHPPLTPIHPSSPVLGPLCHGNLLFSLRPTTHADTHEHRWSERVYLGSSFISGSLLLGCCLTKHDLQNKQGHI